MNIHCAVTFTILLIVVQTSRSTAQRSWNSAFGYHRYENYDWPLIEIQQPKFFDISSFDDDYTKALRRLHLFEPFDSPPIIYLPRIHFAPDVYVDERYPNSYHRVGEPVNPPYLNRFLTTLSVSYKAKILPVRDYIDETKETVSDSLTSSSDNVPKEVSSPANDSTATNKGTTKKNPNGGTNAGTPQVSSNVLPPKPNIKAESVTKPKAETKPENDSDKTTDTNVADPTDSKNIAVDKVIEPVDKVIENSVVGSTDSADAKTKNNVDGAIEQSAVTEIADETTTATVPAA